MARKSNVDQQDVLKAEHLRRCGKTPGDLLLLMDSAVSLDW